MLEMKKRKLSKTNKIGNAKRQEKRGLTTATTRQNA